MTIRQQLLAGFSILIIVFIISFFVNQSLSDEVLMNTDYVNRSETVIRNSNQVHKSILDMQSGFRGFLLTEQESFLEPYVLGLEIVPTLLAGQSKLINTEIQRKRIDSITIFYHDWVNYANSLINAKRDSFPEGSRIYKQLFEEQLKMEVGKKLNNKIKTIFSKFDKYEYQVRQMRRERLQASVDRTKRITLTLTLSSIILAMLSGWFFTRQITGRIAKMVHLAERISQGEFHQISDTKKDELRRLSEALNSMSKTLKTNFQELVVKNKELDQFAYVVSHDLKAPLRGIANLMEWMEEDHAEELTPAIKKNLDLIKGRTKRLENMINGLLDYARIGKVRKGKEVVNTAILIQTIIDELVPQNFSARIEGIWPTLHTERLHLEQVFANLISNAVKYNDKDEGLLILRCEDKGSHYQFEVVDNGPGIQSEYFEKIFMIFQTLKERDAFESTGVGLAIVRKIIEDHKGLIWVSSNFGSGSSFHFTWLKSEI